MLVIYMERDAAEWLLQRIRGANKFVSPHASAQAVEAALIAAIGQASIAHNPHKDFGHLEEHEQRDHGLNAATDAEAAESLK